MSNRHLHPLACRLPRAERNAAVAFARQRGLSVSGMLKAALRQYMAAQAGVNDGVNTFTDPPTLPTRLTPIKLYTKPVRAVPSGKGFRDT